MGRRVNRLWEKREINNHKQKRVWLALFFFLSFLYPSLAQSPLQEKLIEEIKKDFYSMMSDSSSILSRETFSAYDETYGRMRGYASTEIDVCWKKVVVDIEENHRSDIPRVVGILDYHIILPKNENVDELCRILLSKELKIKKIYPGKNKVLCQ